MSVDRLPEIDLKRIFENYLGHSIDYIEYICDDDKCYGYYMAWHGKNGKTLIQIDIGDVVTKVWK